MPDLKTQSGLQDVINRLQKAISAMPKPKKLFPIKEGKTVSEKQTSFWKAVFLLVIGAVAAQSWNWISTAFHRKEVGIVTAAKAQELDQRMGVVEDKIITIEQGPCLLVEKHEGALNAFLEDLKGIRSDLGEMKGMLKILTGQQVGMAKSDGSTH